MRIASAFTPTITLAVERRGELGTGVFITFWPCVQAVGRGDETFTTITISWFRYESGGLGKAERV
jgi:hypothetical protein